MILVRRGLLLGWQVCRTKFPRKMFNFKTKSKTKNETKNSKNAPKCPRKCLSPVQLPKSCLPAIFHSFAPVISTTLSIFSQRESGGMATLILWEGGSGGVQSTAVSKSVRETSRDESQRVPSPEKPFKIKDFELPNF